MRDNAREEFDKIREEMKQFAAVLDKTFFPTDQSTQVEKHKNRSVLSELMFEDFKEDILKLQENMKNDLYKQN